MSNRIGTLRCAARLLLAVAPVLAGSAAQAQEFYLHDGDRVTFYGDSITAQRYYTRDIQDFAETRYPTLQVTWHNAGVPGDKVTGGYAGNAAVRVARDVQPFHPTVITVMLGMNDGDYMAPDPQVFSDYQSGYHALLSLLRAAAPGARMTLIENTPYDEITHGTEFRGYMATTQQNAEATPALGQREGLPVIDDFAPVQDLLRRAKAADSTLAALLEPDRIHPAEPLHWVMAEAVMKAWHLDPVVSDVTLSAASGAVIAGSRTQVSGISTGPGSLAWNQLDQALPLPFNFDNPLMQFVLRISDLASADREMLRVQALPAGEYALAIDGKTVGAFDAGQLAQGVNLALLKTPMWQQARDYDDALGRRSQLEDADFILLAETHVSNLAAASGVLTEGEGQFEEKARESLRIPTRHYVLTRVP